MIILFNNLDNMSFRQEAAQPSKFFYNCTDQPSRPGISSETSSRPTITSYSSFSSISIIRMRYAGCPEKHNYTVLHVNFIVNRTGDFTLTTQFFNLHVNYTVLHVNFIVNHTGDLSTIWSNILM